MTSCIKNRNPAIRITARAIGLAVVLIACTATEAASESEELARFFFREAKNRERQHYYQDAVMFYKKVIDQVPRSELAKRSQDRINHLRATPEMMADAAKQAERKRKQAEAREAAKKRLEEYVQAHPEYATQILARQIALGMSQEDVIAAWGKPDRVNTTVTALGKHEQWIYGDTYVYVSDGRVTSWQTTR